MTKHKTAELSGALLDAAVAKVLGMKYEVIPYRVDSGLWVKFERDEPVCCVDGSRYFEPSTCWNQAGQIFEKYPKCLPQENKRIDTSHLGPFAAGNFTSFGPTPLIAGMRAFVALQLGDVVSL